MKQTRLFTYLMLAIVMISCSSDSNNNSTVSVKINPPGWIQGTWLDESQTVGFKFTNNDMITINFNTEQSQRELLQLGADSGQTVSASDESTSNYYSLVLNFPAGQTVTYSFNKLSDNEINWTTISTSIFIKQ